MSHSSPIFERTKVKVPKLSGRDLSHEVLGTLKCGTLTPVLCHELLPAEKVSLGTMLEAQLPPMASNFYGRVDLRLEAFFVPYRILWGGWEAFFTKEPNAVYPQNFGPHPSSLPYAQLLSSSSVQANRKMPALVRNICSSLRYKFQGTIPTVPSGEYHEFKFLNPLPFLAYHKIYDEWYRNSMVEKPLFIRPTSGKQIDGYNLMHLPYQTHDSSDPNAYFLVGSLGASDTTEASIGFASGALFFNGDNFFSLHQRNWSKDRFTTCTLTPQAGEDSKVTFQTPNESGEFTIASLRAANTIQKWLDRNNIAGYRYADQILATFGVLPSDAIIQRPLFLGGTSLHLYNRSVFQTSNQGEGQFTNVNPFSSVGTKYADSRISGEDSLIDEFQAKEHGFIMVLASLVPHAYYSTGTNRMHMRSSVTDFPDPLLQGLGEQPVYNYELTGITSTDSDFETFGYNQQYCESKYIDDYVFGELEDGRTLEYFALKRGFQKGTELGKDFLSIPTDFLSQVKAMSSSDSSEAWDIDCWFDIYFKFKHVSVLADYVIPTLGDPHIFRDQNIPYRGRQL